MKIKGIRLGNAWQYSKKHLGLVIPILKDNATKRNYVMAEEIEKKIDIKDTGDIGKINITMDHDKPVFIRSGIAFKGQGTQSRAVKVSVVAMPKRVTPILVNCIHASHPIRQYSSFRMCGSVPRAVHYSLMRGDQGRVWNSVSCCASPQAIEGRISNDDLLGNMEAIEGLKSDVNDIIKEVPSFENQVGIAVFDYKGIAGIEVFDSPESWEAISKDVIKKYNDTLSRKQENQVYKIDNVAVQQQVWKFLEKLDKIQNINEVFNNKSAKTFCFEFKNGNDYIGEYTQISSKTIHLLVSRIEEELMPKPSSRPVGFGNFRLSSVGLHDRRTHDYTYRGPDLTPSEDRIVRFFREKKDSVNWKDMNKKFKMSSATLSKGLKNLEKRGYIARSSEISDRKARVKYELTGFGHSVKY